MRGLKRAERSISATQTGVETYSSAMADARNYMAWILNAFGLSLGPLLEIGVGHTAVNSQISLFDSWLVPISRGLDPVSRTLYAQSVLAIGRKP
jgi:hypothetical protein